MPLAVTMGEPSGIGGEITLKAWLEYQSGSVKDGCPFFLLGDPLHLTSLAEQMGLPVPVENIASPDNAIEVFNRALPVLPVSLPSPVKLGQPDPANAEAVLKSIRRAVEFCLGDQAAGIVTNPIRKQTLYQAGFRHAGHTEYLAELCGSDCKPVMMLACPDLRVVPVTIHCSLRDAVKTLTTELIVEHATITNSALKGDFGIASPRLVVAGLNPHAGEGGTLGEEEMKIIAPAVERLEEMSIQVRGPAPADSLFHPAARTTYDACLCMYHDQALIPIKTIDFEHGVNITLGLPIVRTSPDHGTALDIAGTGTASPSSLVSALHLAADISRRRILNA